jgi:hypothetical protein
VESDDQKMIFEGNTADKQPVFEEYGLFNHKIMKEGEHSNILSVIQK